jgi:SAM-dependent methyltransferase
MHDAVLQYVAANLPASADDVLEFGSRNLNGSVRQVIPWPEARYVGVDLYEGPDVNVVGDAATVTVAGEFDVVVCTELFEHAEDDTCAAIIDNAHRHLRPGGRFIATMAGPGRYPHSAIEATSLQPGEFYRNVDPELLVTWLKGAGFGDYEINIEGLDIRCVGVKP